MNKLIKGVLGTLFKMSDQEITEILKKSDGSEGIDEDKVLQTIIDKDKDRIQKIKDGEVKWADAMKKATREVWSKVEELIKGKTGIESDLQGEELVDLVAKTVKEKPKPEPGKKPEEMTDDDIKKHPVFLAAEKQWKKSLQDKETEMTQAVQKVKDEYSHKETFSKITSSALTKFKKAFPNVILPKDPAKAELYVKKMLLDELTGYDYQAEGDDRYLILHKDGDKKGKRVEDEHGHALDFDGLIEKIAKRNFEFKASTDRSGPTNGADTDDPKDEKKVEKKYKGKAPSNQKEYLEYLTNPDLSYEQKLEIKADYGGTFSN